MKWIHDDGGRTESGFRKGTVADCVARALAIASGETYTLVYDRLAAGNRSETRRAGRKRTLGAHEADYGINTEAPWFKVLMAELGFDWMATTLPNGNAVTMLRPDELPMGRLVVAIQGHYSAVLDGVLHDTFDASREGKAAVYGYWMLRQKQATGAARILDKVKKLLALSEGTANLHEAELATQRVEELLAAHNLSMADALAHGQALNGEADRISERFATPHLDYAFMKLWCAVADAHYCKIVYNPPQKQGEVGYRYTLIGRRSNVQASAMLAEYLSEAMLRLTADAVELNRRLGAPVHGRTVRKDFMLGMVATLRRRLSDRKRADKTPEASMTAGPSDSTALALWGRDEGKANEEYQSIIFPHLSAASYSPSVMAGSAAYAAGKAAGERVSLAPQINTSDRKRIR